MIHLVTSTLLKRARWGVAYDDSRLSVMLTWGYYGDFSLGWDICQNF